MLLECIEMFFRKIIFNSLYYEKNIKTNSVQTNTRFTVCIFLLFFSEGFGTGCL